MGETSEPVDRLKAALRAFVAWNRDEETRETLLARHEDLRDLIEPMLADEEAPAPDEEERTIGDYRILRELGRGGMGVVFEAHQISLGRKVALKVLPDRYAAHPTAFARFKREASLAAKLQHPRIVGVYDCGNDGDVHFIAMELVVGAPLDEILASVQDRSPSELAGSVVRDAVEAATVRPATESRASRAAEDAAASRVFRSSYLETMVRIVIQVAEALAHAHAHGVLHRDVKPANILVRADGAAMLADFGLAKQEDLPSLTQTGEFAGTPYYVSPEQILAKRAPMDGRTDVFSLGATLYEIVTSVRPFGGETTQEVLQNILTKEPRDPTSVNPALARDLGAIILKALEKNPPGRYAGAEEFAADLRAFLEYRPVSARRASVAKKIRRWMRREPLKTSLAAALALIILVVGAWGASRLARERTRTTKIEAALDDARRQWPLSHGAVRSALALLETRDSSELAAEVRRLARELAVYDRNARFLRELQDVRQPEADPWYPIDWKDVAAEYATVFEREGLDLLSGSVAEATSRFTARAIDAAQTVALTGIVDTWARTCARAGLDSYAKRLTQIAGKVDDDAQRGELRAALLARDPVPLAKFARRDDLSELPATTLELLGGALRRVDRPKLALAVYRAACEAHAQDFVLRIGLARTLTGAEPRREEEAARHYTVALALRPDSIEVRHELGKVLFKLGKARRDREEIEAAVSLFRQSLRRRPRDAHLWMHLGETLGSLGRHEEEVQAYRKAIALDSELGGTHVNLGLALLGVKEFAEAKEHLEKAIRARDSHGIAWLGMGQAQLAEDDLDAAHRSFEKATAGEFEHLEEKAQAWSYLGLTHSMLGRPEPALDAFQRALQVDSKLDGIYPKIVALLRDGGELEEAERMGRVGLALNPEDPQIYFHLHYTLLELDKPEECLPLLKRSFGLGQNAEAHFHVGEAYLELERFDKALESFRTVLRLTDTFPEAWGQISEVYKRMQRYSDALDAARRLARLSRNTQQGTRTKQIVEWAQQDFASSEVIRGTREPSSAEEAVHAAMLAYENENRPMRAVTLFGKAFAADPSLVRNRESRPAFTAACAAATAASQRATEDPNSSRALRQKALAWLQADLTAWERLEDSAAMRHALEHWFESSPLESLRDDETLQSFPATERAQWQALWSSARELLAGSRAKNARK